MPGSNVLRIEDLTVQVGSENGGHTILKNFSLSIDQGEVHVLLGPNGAGKSTLLYTVLGYPNYKVLEGRIFFKGEDITGLPVHERVQKGMGIVFQNPPKIPGVRLRSLVDVCGQQREKALQGVTEFPDGACPDLSSEILELAQKMNFPPEYLERSVNVGFSGGEVKRSEIIQMMALQPDFMLFDEPDSGVDVENVELLGKVMRQLLQRDEMPSHQTRAALIITHLGYILQFIGKIDRAHVMIDGKIRCSGIPSTILGEIQSHGFEGCLAHCVRGTCGVE
ncbi:MAG: ABC transporter ATP-binding protein [Promethearchaeota archaeon]